MKIYRCPHLVRAARGSRKPTYRSPVVSYIDNETWEGMKNEYNKRATRRKKEKEKYGKQFRELHETRT